MTRPDSRHDTDATLTPVPASHIESVTTIAPPATAQLIKAVTGVPTTELEKPGLAAPPLILLNEQFRI